MAAGRIVLSQYFPARDRNARLVSGALLYVYTNGTTTKASIYSNEALTTPLANPVAANSSGQFPAIWASDAATYTLSITASDGSSIGNPSVFDDYSVSVDADTASVALAEAAATSAAADLADMLAVVATGDDAAAIAARAAKAQNGADFADTSAVAANIGGTETGIAVFKAASAAAAQSSLDVPSNADLDAVETAKYPTYNGQSGTGTALAKLNTAITSAALGGQVWNPSTVNVGTTAPTNNVGAIIEGAPVLYTSTVLSSAGSATGSRVFNKPGRSPALLHYGLERLFPSFHRIRTVSGLKIVLIGDSNTVGYAGARLAVLLAEEMPLATIYNWGISGASASMFLNGTGQYAAGQPGEGKALTDVIALEAHLIIDGFGGTNDPHFGATAEQFIATKDAIYTAMRAATNGAKDRLGIVSCTSAMMNDATGTGPEYRDEAFNARVRPGIMALCEKYSTAFFDKNGIAPDAFVETDGAFVENYNLDSARVHTQNEMTEHIAQSLYNFLFPDWFKTAAASPSRVAVTAGTGFALPANDEATWTRATSFIVQAGGYMTMNTPAALTMGTVLATISTDHRPRKIAYRQATAIVWGGTAVDDNSSWEELPCNVKTDGSVVVIKTGAMTPTRIWLYGNWEANV